MDTISADQKIHLDLRPVGKQSPHAGAVLLGAGELHAS